MVEEGATQGGLAMLPTSTRKTRNTRKEGGDLRRCRKGSWAERFLFCRGGVSVVAIGETFGGKGFRSSVEGGLVRSTDESRRGCFGARGQSSGVTDRNLGTLIQMMSKEDY
jgi:hypothetical protein